MKSPLLVAICACLAVAAGPAEAQDPSSANWREKPWLEPQDTTMATFAPDEYAWRLFLAMNWPARATGCGPDTAKKIGDAGPTVWERWAIKTDVFLAGAAKPKAWAELCGEVPVAKTLQPSAQLALARQARAGAPPQPGSDLEFSPPAGDASGGADEEVRLNESAFNFIRDQGLYSRTRQQAMAAAGVKAIDFPRMGKEVRGALGRPAQCRRPFALPHGEDGRRADLRIGRAPHHDERSAALVLGRRTSTLTTKRDGRRSIRSTLRDG